MTSLVMTTSSRAHLSDACLRFTSCFIAVRKPCMAEQATLSTKLGLMQYTTEQMQQLNTMQNSQMCACSYNKKQCASQ